MAFDFSSYDAVLLDMDGTIYHEEHPLPGAVDLLRRLQREGRAYACISNSTTSPERLTQRLARMGANVPPGQIYTAAAALVDLVLERYGTAARIYNLSTDGVLEMLNGKVRWVESPAEPCDAVIAGTTTNAHATEARQRVALALLRQGAALLGICADRVFPSARGIEFGSGAFCAYLGYAANVTPTFCGKPQPEFFLHLCQRMGVAPQRCLLIGDNLETDIGGGRAVGMTTMLVLTGVVGAADLERAPDSQRPHIVVNDLTRL